MWKKKSVATFAIEIDAANSWSEESLQPADVVELSMETLEPRSLPIRVSKLTTRTTGFLFPEASQWQLPPKPADAIARPANTNARKSKQPPQRHRIRPPSDIVKLQDRLYYLLQPPLDLLGGQRPTEFSF